MAILVNGGIGGAPVSVPDGTTVLPVAGVVNPQGRVYALINPDGTLTGIGGFTVGPTTATTTGTLAPFSTSSATRMLVTLAQASGTVSQAIVQLQRVDTGAVLGVVYYPQGTPRFIDLPGGSVNVQFNVTTLTGSSPGLAITGTT